MEMSTGTFSFAGAPLYLDWLAVQSSPLDCKLKKRWAES